MNLNQLRAFYSVIKAGSFSKAAEMLFVTEPAVFMQVRSLERDIGFTLLDKLGKELHLTEVGKLLYNYSEKIFILEEEAANAVQEFRNIKKGLVQIGVTKALAQYLMSFVISSFHGLHPNISFTLHEGSSQKLVEWILQHRFELAIVASVPYPDKINAIPFSKDEILPVFSPKNRLIGRKIISMEELSRQPVILTDARSATKSIVWEEFKKRGIEPSTIIEAGNTDFIKQQVKGNEGYAFLASLCVRDEIKKGELTTIPLLEGKFFMDIDVIHLREKTLSPATFSFLNFLQKHNKTNMLTDFADEISASGFPRT